MKNLNQSMYFAVKINRFKTHVVLNSVTTHLIWAANSALLISWYDSLCANDSCWTHITDKMTSAKQKGCANIECKRNEQKNNKFLHENRSHRTYIPQTINICSVLKNVKSRKRNSIRIPCSMFQHISFTCNTRYQIRYNILTIWYQLG